MLKLPPDEIVRMKKMVPTVRELRIVDALRDYRAIRKNYYGNRIPPAEEVTIAFVPGQVLKSIYHDGCLGFYVRGITNYVGLTVIVIAEESGVNETRMTLLHETCHLSVDSKWNRNMGHGKYFKKEARRLMAAGALDDWF
jgi:SprT-like family protein